MLSVGSVSASEPLWSIRMAALLLLPPYCSIVSTSCVDGNST